LEEFSNADGKNNSVNGGGDIGGNSIGDGEENLGKNDGL